MKLNKRKRLEEAGWKVGSAKDFLALTPENTTFVDNNDRNLTRGGISTSVPRSEKTDFDIPRSEYEQRRHVFDLCRWINAKLEEMQTQPDFDTIYFERPQRIVKKLIEEAMPLACLGLYLFKPADDVYVRCLSGNQRYDGELSVTGWSNFQIKVEVTTVETDESTMRRQALSRNGSVFMMGKIGRKGRNIISEPEMVDLNLENKYWVDLAFQRFRKKIERGYDKETAILVNFSNFRHITLRHRSELIERTEEYLLQEKPEIYGVYYSYGDDFVVDGVKSRL
jgi:hypothetical protein